MLILRACVRARVYVCGINLRGKEVFCAVGSLPDWLFSLRVYEELLLNQLHTSQITRLVPGNNEPVMYSPFLMHTDLLGLSEVLVVLLSPTLNRRLDGVGCTRANLGSCTRKENVCLRWRWSEFPSTWKGQVAG